MAFAQLAYRERLRDIQVCLRAIQSRLYHLGIRGKVSRFEKEPIYQVLLNVRYTNQEDHLNNHVNLFD